MKLQGFRAGHKGLKMGARRSKGWERDARTPCRRGTDLRSLSLRESGRGTPRAVSVSGGLRAWFRLRSGCGFCYASRWLPLQRQKPSFRYGRNGSRYTPHPASGPSRSTTAFGVLLQTYTLAFRFKFLGVVYRTCFIENMAI